MHVPVANFCRLLLAWGSLLLTLVATAQGDDLRSAARGVQQIIAHRGASSERPECTLSAISRAIEVGATAVEVDVRTSSDGALFILHDATLDRTTNGSGPASKFTLTQLQRLDAGSWFDVKYKNERIPSLREALIACRGKIDILLDLKERGEPYAKAVAKAVRRYGDEARTVVGVRSVEQAKWFRRHLPKARQLGLIPKPQSIEAFAAAGVETIRLWPRWVTGEGEALPQRVRRGKVKLHLNGGVGALEETRSLLRFRPNSLSSDHPARLIATLHKLGGAKKR